MGQQKAHMYGTSCLSVIQSLHIILHGTCNGKSTFFWMDSYCTFPIINNDFGKIYPKKFLKYNWGTHMCNYFIIEIKDGVKFGNGKIVPSLDYCLRK